MTFAFPIAPYLIIVLGLIIFLLGIPNFRRATVGRLQAKDLLPAIKLKKKDREIVYAAGSDLSLMMIGAIIIVIGIYALVT
jgi:hypothetical protein